MTIEEAIEHGKEQLEIFGGEHKEFIKTAIETMRKYQKIEDIYYHQSGQALENSLRAVIEDGKID